MLKDFDIQPVLTTTKNPQSNIPVVWVRQEKINMLIIKDILNKVFDYIDIWGENLKYIAWEIRASYPRTIKVT